MRVLGQALFVDLVEKPVLANRREEVALLALELDAQEVDDVGLADGFLEVVADAHAVLLEAAGDQRAGAADGDFGAEFGEGPDVGSGDAAVDDVAEDDDFEALEGALLIENGVGIEEALGRMLVGAVAGVQDGGPNAPAEIVGRARSAVAHDDEVGAHGLDGASGVEEGLALGDAGRGDAEVDDVGAESLGGDLEAGAGARGVLEEEVDDRLAAQSGYLLHRPGEYFFERPGGFEDEEKFLFGHVLESQEVFSLGDAFGGRGRLGGGCHGGRGPPWGRFRAARERRKKAPR